MRFYSVNDKFYQGKDEALEAAKKLAAPKWTGDHFDFGENAGRVEVKALALEGVGAVIQFMNGNINKASKVGIIVVTADISLREANNKDAKPNFNMQRVGFPKRERKTKKE